ncbi:MAG: ABC transporter permease [Candidatus Nanohalarchaeota archaeon]|nr:MAG: ABC transporter permease [Candidatus Nanohaloarchaeota archaeon]
MLMKNIKENKIQIYSVFFFLFLWQIISQYIINDPLILPSVSDVIKAFFELSGSIPIDIAVSLLHLSTGLFFALIIGIPIGALMGWYRSADQFFNPIIEMLRPIPPLAWIPFAIIWFGLSDYSAGFIILIGALFPILTNTYTGFRNTPLVLVEAAKVLGCKKNINLIKYIALPSSFPYILSGIRISIGIGWMCVVAAEMFGLDNYGFGNVGVGNMLWQYYALHMMDRVALYMLILGVIGILMDRLLKHAEANLLKWKKGTNIRQI